MAIKTIVDTDSAQALSSKTLIAPTITAGVCTADPSDPLGIATMQFVLAQLGVVFPTGGMMPYGGSVPPSSGWLLCDGSAVNRTTYAALFAVCGTTYGAGDGSTTFNVPDKRGRGSIGAGTGSGLTARTRGTKLGTESETAPLAVHDHGERTVNPAATGDTELVRSGGAGGSTVHLPLTASAASFTQVQIKTDPSGVGGTHNNVQPSEVDTWIIKT